MSYYLLDNDTRIDQCRSVRRNGAVPSGVVVLHTAENATDYLGADAGAEGVARFIRDRTSYGSYHVLCDSDSTVYLAPWSYETWNDTRTNNHNVGISGAVSCADWQRLGARGDRIVVRMAVAAREYATWLHRTRGVVIPARRITRSQALDRVPGFIGHGEIDTERRSDPGRDFNWALFLAVYAAPTLAASHGVTIGGDLPSLPDLPGLTPIEEDEVTPDDIAAIADAVWRRSIAEAGGIGPASAEDWLKHTAIHATDARKLARSTEVIAGRIEAAVKAIPGGEGVSPDALAEAVRAVLRSV